MCLFASAGAKKFTGIPMCALLANKRYELLYNCGIQLLHIGRPLAAFECLMEAVQVYHSNPRLWLRLAECCITANKGVQILTSVCHIPAFQCCIVWNLESFILKMHPEVVVFTNYLKKCLVCFNILTSFFFRAQSKKQKACPVKRGLSRLLLAKATTARLF